MHQYCLIGFSILLVLNSCGPIVCNAEYVSYYLIVVDKEENPVELDSIKVTNLETKESYPACNADASNFPCLGLSPSADDPNYYYQIMNDGFEKLIKRSGSRILVEGSKDSKTFREEYVFSSGPCGVNLESGSLEIKLE